MNRRGFLKGVMSTGIGLVFGLSLTRNKKAAETFSWTDSPYRPKEVDNVTALFCRWTRCDGRKFCTAILCEDEDIVRTKKAFEKRRRRSAVRGGGWLDDGKPLRLA